MKWPLWFRAYSAYRGQMPAKRQHWKKKPSPRPFNRAGELTPEEQECVRVALRVLRVRYGSYAKVGEVMGVHPKAVVRAASGRWKPTIGVALEAARLARVPVDDILAGRFPEPGACPFCGRSEE